MVESVLQPFELVAPSLLGYEIAYDNAASRPSKLGATATQQA